MKKRYSYWILCFFLVVITHRINAQSLKDSAEARLCEWAMKETTPIRVTQQLDSLMASGVNINCKCEVSHTYRNLYKAIGNKIKNGLTRFFLGRNARNLANEYETQKTFYTPIHLWVLAEERELISYAIKQYKADLNIEGSKGYPLEEVVKSNNVEYAQWLVTMGAKVKNLPFCTTKIEMAEWLLSQGLRIEDAQWDCISDHEETFQYLLTKYKPDLANARYYHKSIATKGLSPSTLQLIFENGIVPNAEMIDSYLHQQNKSKMYEYVKIFAKFNANFTECGFFACPLEHAIKAEDIASINLLLERGVLTVKKPLCTENFEIIALLINKGFDKAKIQPSCFLDSPERLKVWIDKYAPPLDYLSGNDILKSASPACLEILFAKGIKPKGDLLSHLMTFNTDKALLYVEAFVKYKQDIQACGFFGCPMQIAIDKQNLNVVKLLVEHGSSLNQLIKDNRTPLEYAQLRFPNSLVTKYLEEKTKK